MILNIYKPREATSFSIVAKVRRLLNIKKVGHAGTLDPLADGVLVVLTEKDTKKQDEIMKQPKEYEAEITFGITTPSFDMEFTPELISHTTYSAIKDKIPSLLEKYIGEFDQEIPIYSAKKVSGKPLYELARKGKEIASDVVLTKKVSISELKILSHGDHVVTTNAGEVALAYIVLKVACSHGTYVRALARDLGNDLGCKAILTKLVRTKVGKYSIENALPLDNLKSQAH